MQEPGEQNKPNWQEIFKGKDVVRGEEIVNNLLSEGVGIPVYTRNLNDKKVSLMVDKQVGEQDVTFRQKEERNDRLLGLLIPTAEKNEFVYLGIEEGGFVFRTDDRRASEFHKDTASSFLTYNRQRFGEWVSFLVQSGYKQDTKVILKEEDDPSRFMEVVVSAVAKEREKMQQVKEKRAGIRDDLMKKLFGQQ